MRPTWDGASILADSDAYFGLMNQKTVPREVWGSRVAEVLAASEVHSRFVNELAANIASQDFIS